LRSLAATRRTASRKRSLSGSITVPPLTTAASLRCFPRRLVISRERRLVRRIALVSSSGYGMTILAA
jgi:hypothetical protein